MEFWNPTLSPAAAIGLAALVGLLIGSFLNVVVYRLPVMMERQWAAELAQAQADAAGPSGEPAPSPSEPFNLMVPRSRCPGCGHRIAWYENLPVLSWLALRGRCSCCGTRIAWRYPLVELATAALFAFCAWHWGVSVSMVMWCGFSAALIALGLIDWDTTLLPDSITMPLLWAGLIAAQLQWIGLPLPDALWGAIVGYLSLWLVYWAFKLATGKEGMGYGDFKLFGALGAWFGWQALVPMILMASVVGAVIGIGMKMSGTLREGRYVPFGPFLAAAGLVSMVAGPQALLQFIGF